MDEAIKLLLVIGEPLTRLGVHTVLERENNITIVDESDNSSDGFARFREFKPDVAILSLRLRDSCTLDDLDNYFIENPKAKIIVFAEHAGDAEITRALKKGVLGYICRDVSPDELVKAVRAVAAGRKFIPGDVAAVLSESIGKEELTPAESNILRMIVGGMSNKEIAFALDISENTVKTHTRNIFDKLGVSDRTTAATTAIKRGLVRTNL